MKANKIYLCHVVLILMLTVFGMSSLQAQTPQEDSTSVAAEESTTAMEDKDFTLLDTTQQPFFDQPKLLLGIHAGTYFSDMHYTDASLDCYNHIIQTFPMLGFFMQMPIDNNGFSVRPEIAFATRGDSLRWHDVGYFFKVRYLDFRFPMTYNFRLAKRNWSPYLMVAPHFDLAWGGSVGYSADDFDAHVRTEVTSANVSDYDASVLIGGGLDFQIPTSKMPVFMSLEVAYNLGLLNTFSKREQANTVHQQSNILNNFLDAELWYGKRFNRGVELSVRIAVPLDYDYVKRYKRSRLPDTVVLVRKETVTKTDTVVEKVEVQVEVPVPMNMRSAQREVGYVNKECYTIDELSQKLDNGEDITGLRVCMFNINFDFDSYKIRPESEGPLNELYRIMRDYPQMTIEVYGHTDSIGPVDYNQRLSENRAKSVVDYLAKRGISPSRVKWFGYGLNYPLESNATEEGRFRNRRVEFDIITTGKRRGKH